MIYSRFKTSVCNVIVSSIGRMIACNHVFQDCRHRHYSLILRLRCLNKVSISYNNPDSVHRAAFC